MGNEGLEFLGSPQLVTEAYQRWGRSRALLFSAIHAASSILIVLLWRSGYPPWRCGALGVLIGLLFLSNVLHPLGLFTWTRTWLGGNEQGLRLLVLLMVAVTGGVHSPFLIVTFGTLPGLFVHYGVSQYTYRTFAMLAVGTLAMFIAPADWLGPPISDPTYKIIASISLLLVGTLHADYLTMISRSTLSSLRDLFLARESVAQLELTRTRRLETIASTLSHELKNPLGAIKALVQVSARASEDPSERKRLQVIESEVDRMTVILQGYLSFSRPVEPLERSTVRLGEIADEVLSVMEARAGKAGVSLRRKGDGQVWADPRRLKEALINLVANAIEASPPQSLVEVELTQAGADTRVTVRDSGRGMAPDVVARIGTPFFTTRPDGTGLGVSLARAVFAQHGGTLEYTSAPGSGTAAMGSLPNDRIG